MTDPQMVQDPVPARTGGQGRGKRVSDLEAARKAALAQKAVDLTPDQARALIDRVFRSYGLDPKKATDEHGWHYLRLGSAQGAVGIIEMEPGEHHLVVRSAVLRLPPEDRHLAEFYRLLLELNHEGTRSTRFSVHEGVVGVSLSRPLRSLDEVEVDDAIRTVMVVADIYDEWLQGTLDGILDAAPPS
jgi:hypothetical protein